MVMSCKTVLFPVLNGLYTLCFVSLFLSILPTSSSGQTPIVDNHFIHTEFSFLVLFDTDKHETNRVPIDKIEKLLNISRDQPSGLIQLEARTDNRAGWSYNLALADRRMNFVKSILLRAGIPENRFEEHVYGKGNPLRENTTNEGRQQNRSVLVSLIEKVPVEILEGRIVSEKDGSGVQGLLYLGSRFVQDSVETDSDGYFSLKVPKDGIISLEFYSEDHAMERTYYNLTRDRKKMDALGAKALEPGVVFNFEHILFVSNQATLMPSYQNALPRLLVMVQKAENYKLEIQGHVNYPKQPPQGKGTFFYSLSENRARKVYNYLVHHGVDSSRLEWKPYSNSQMIHPRATTEMQMRQNRRVAIKVLERVETK